MKIFLIILISIYFLPSFADDHKTNFKDIKGFKKQFISMHKKKVNRINEVKKSDGFPVYEGKTSINTTTAIRSSQSYRCRSFIIFIRLNSNFIILNINF